MEQTAPSLYDDWIERRRRVKELSECEVPQRVLNYLLFRYRDDPIAKNAARFPLPSKAFFDLRTMLVHRHLSFSPKADVRNSTDATRKVSRILQRIRDQAPQESVGAPANGALFGGQVRHSMKRIADSMIDPYLVQATGANTQFLDANDGLRLKLLSSEPQDRVNAAQILAEQGTLDDVSLFLDLIALPPDAEMTQKLSPVIERPSEVPPVPVGSGIGAPYVLPSDPPEPPKKPRLTPEELEQYRNELMDNFADVTSIVNLLNDTGPPQMPLPCTDEDAGVPLPEKAPIPEFVPEPLDERKILEACAMRLAQKEHKPA